MKPIRGLTLFSIVDDIVIFGGFIYANEYAVTGLLTAFSWFFWFVAGLAITAILTKSVKAAYQYTLFKFRYELISNILLGFMLAFYGHYTLASILAFWGIVCTGVNYKTEDLEKKE